MPFTQINPALSHALALKGYTTPTPVQQSVLEKGLNGQDLLVSAQTGSGKTVAYGLAMAPTLLGNKASFGPATNPLALIVAPTRELALQVHQELTWLYDEAKAKIITCIGGMNVRKETQNLERGCHIVVGTPGRLCDHIRRRHLNLSSLKVIVLDEADEMLDLGFRDELEELLSTTPENRRTLLFSATIDKEIESLARNYQKQALRINTISSAQQHRDIEYRAVVVAPREIDNAIVNLLRYIDSPTAMIFCATREMVRHMHTALLERGFSSVSLSGDLGQDERTHAIESLRTGQVKVCVATDVAARGLDLPTLDLVIHASLPTNPATLLHRSGRTGRAGRKGVCCVIVPNNQRGRAERLLSMARVTATWGNAPSIQSIRDKDNERLLSYSAFANPEDITTEDQPLIQQLTENFSLEHLAKAVISLYRSTMPYPEEITPVNLESRRSSIRNERSRDKSSSPSRNKPTRESMSNSSWFEIPVGRKNKADPKWLIPLICKVGKVQKRDIGDIRISDQSTRFEIAAKCADDFKQQISRANNEEVKIYPASSTPNKSTGPRKKPNTKSSRIPAKGSARSSSLKKRGRSRKS